MRIASEGPNIGSIALSGGVDEFAETGEWPVGEILGQMPSQEPKQPRWEKLSYIWEKTLDWGRFALFGAAGIYAIARASFCILEGLEDCIQEKIDEGFEEAKRCDSRYS